MPIRFQGIKEGSIAFVFMGMGQGTFLSTGRLFLPQIDMSEWWEEEKYQDIEKYKEW